MAAPLPPEYDPTFDFEMPVAGYEIMGLATLSAFAVIGIGAFFTYAAAETGAALDISYTVGGSTIMAGGTALTEGQAVILAVAEAEGITGFGAALLEVIIDGGFTALFSVDSLVALSLYRPSPLDTTNFGNFGSYLGRFANGLPGGGLTTPPGFPGFIGGGYPPGSFFVCYKVNDEYMCHRVY